MILGLGLGIILSSFVVALWPASSISNAYIEDLARGIGMGYPEDFLFSSSEESIQEEGTQDVEPPEENGTGLLPEEGVREDEVYLESPDEDQVEEDLSAEEEIVTDDLEEPFEGDEIKVSIPRGSSSGRIAMILEQEGVLTDGEGFAKMVRGTHLSRIMGSGDFIFPKEARDDWEQVLSIMTGGANQ